jgi:hypothetical protein
MKILYLTKGDHVDYQNDCVLIGLKELFEYDVIDLNKQLHNYTSYDAEKAKTLYGRGMTVTRVLPDLEIDRTDITSKIKNKYFDLIVYGSIWRCSDHLDKILEYYSPNQIIAIDGEDETGIHPCYQKGLHYFKRELIYTAPRLHSISFAIPTSKVSFNKGRKAKDIAFINPLDRSTYIYNNEADYYNDYRTSYFGITLKKAGWDCMRHYEIIGNGCLPQFLNIEQCPPLTMVNFPKQECKEINAALADKENASGVYERYVDIFEDFLYNYGTTKAVAQNLLKTWNDTK